MSHEEKDGGGATDESDTLAAVETLVQRYAFVDALREERRTKRDLAALDVSRPTVYRGLRDLEAVVIVERNGEAYAPTTYGTLVADRFGAFLGSVESAAEIESFLRWVPPGTLDLDPRHLADADVYSGSPGDLAATGRFDVRVATDDVPFYLGVLDDVTQLGVDDDGQPRALLETDVDVVRNWAIETFERWWTAAAPIDLGDGSDP